MPSPLPYFLSCLTLCLLLTPTTSMPSPPPLSAILLAGPDPDNPFPPQVYALQTPIAIRYATLLSVARYEVISACYPNSLGFLAVRNYIPPPFCLDLNHLVQITLTVEYRLISDSHPSIAPIYATFLSSNGVDITNSTRDTSTIPGIANTLADPLVQYFRHDGWNALGDLTRHNFRRSFDDPTAYRPKNHASQPSANLSFPLRWQPQTLPVDHNGLFSTQVHVVPHIGTTARPLILSPRSLDTRRVQAPYSTPNLRHRISKQDDRLLRTQVRKVFKRSRGLTNDKIRVAYFWENKFRSLGTFLSYYGAALKFTPLDFSRISLGEMIAQHDAVLAAWKEKRRHDVLRPTSAIRRLLTGRVVRAWRPRGGVGKVKAEEWEPLIPAQSHSEYPSGSAAVCAASFQHLDVALKSMFRNATIPPFVFVLDGKTEPQSGRKRETTVVINGFEEAAASCGESRLDAGVHFEPAVEAGYELVSGIGRLAFEHVTDLVEGRVPKNCRRCVRT